MAAIVVVPPAASRRSMGTSPTSRRPSRTGDVVRALEGPPDEPVEDVARRLLGGGDGDARGGVRRRRRRQLRRDTRHRSSSQVMGRMTSAPAEATASDVASIVAAPNTSCMKGAVTNSACRASTAAMPA